MKYFLAIILLVLGYIFFSSYSKSDFLTAGKTVSNNDNQSSAASSPNEGQPISDLNEPSAEENVVTSALEAKLNHEKKLDASMQSEILNENVQTIIVELKAKGIELPADLLARMRKNDLTEEDLGLLMEYVSSVLPEGEVEFRKQTLGFDMGFDELSQLYTERSKTTGLNYDQEMLGNSQIYKDISVDELDALLAKGNILPAGIINHISKYQRADLLKNLHDKGYLNNVNYVNPYTHRNALEEFVNQYTSSAGGAVDGAKSVNYIDQLLAVGAAPSTNDNTRDALDFALQNMSTTNTDKVIDVVQKLLNAGLKIEASHVELLKQFQGSHPAEYDQYVLPVVRDYSKVL